MSEEELNEIFYNIQFQMVCEQNSGYKKEYSKSLQQKINLYNHVIDLKQALIDIREYINKHELIRNITEEIYFLKDVVAGKDILQIIDKYIGSDK